MFNYEEAERRLRAGATKVRRLAWSRGAYLALDCSTEWSRRQDKPMLLDLGYGAFWDLMNEDRLAEDWVEDD